VAYRPRSGWATRKSWPSAVPALDWTRAIVIPPCIIFGLVWGYLNLHLCLYIWSTWGYQGGAFLGGGGALSFLQATNILVGVYVLVLLVVLARGRGRLAWMARVGCVGVLLFTVFLHVFYHLVGGMHFVFPS